MQIYTRLHNKVISFKVLYQVISILKLLLKRELREAADNAYIFFYGISDKEGTKQASERKNESLSKEVIQHESRIPLLKIIIAENENSESEHQKRLL